MALEDGERVIPDLMGSCRFTRTLLWEHMERYKLAQRYAAGRTILDIACGVGYGTKMLKERTDKEVTGSDLSSHALEYAAARYGAPGITWVQADAEEFNAFDDFDMVVSFETIEHLVHPARFVARVFDALPPGGIFCVSAPVVKTTKLDKFHRHDFTARKLRDLVTGAGFEIIEELPSGFRYYPWDLVHARLVQPPANKKCWGKDHWKVSWWTILRLLLLGLYWGSLALVCRRGKGEAPSELGG